MNRNNRILEKQPIMKKQLQNGLKYLFKSREYYRFMFTLEKKETKMAERLFLALIERGNEEAKNT